MIDDDGYTTVYPPDTKRMRKVMTHNGKIEITVAEHERLKRIEDAAMRIRDLQPSATANCSAAYLEARVALWKALDS